MSTILFRNAVVLINGAELTGALHEFGLQYSAEMLDETTFGDDTRIHKGGLFMGHMDGKGYFDGAVGIETVLFAADGVDDSILVAFPDGVTEGSQTTGVGYAMKGVLGTLAIGGQVGALLAVDFSADSRGIEA